MARDTLCGYEFKDFNAELERTNVRHPHVVRREPGTVYKDEFALQQIHHINPELYNQYLRGWARSYYDPNEHLKAIVQYGSPNIPISTIVEPVYQQAITNVKNGLRSLPNVRALNVLSDLDKVPFKSSSAAGYDYRGEKGPINGLNHERAIKRAKAILWSAIRMDGEGIEHVIKTAVPDVGYTRTQLTDLREKMKVRSVWGRSFHTILLEGTVAHPLLKAFQESDTFYHIGRDPIESVPKILSDIARDCKWIYALDWKQFDATVSRFEIHAAFDIIKSKVTFPNLETEEAFEICKQLFIHKKIAAPDGYIYWSHKGIPSGSYYTSVVGSIVNRLRIEYLWLILHQRQPKVCFTQGDDSILGDDELTKPVTIANYANAIGWYFNPSKTEYSTMPEMVTFLGRTFYGGLNVRDLKRCLRLLVYPEYPVETGRISAYRAKSIAEDAGRLSEILNTVATKLRRQYGIASEDEVPVYFKRYIHSV